MKVGKLYKQARSLAFRFLGSAVPGELWQPAQMVGDAARQLECREAAAQGVSSTPRDEVQPVSP